MTNLITDKITPEMMPIIMVFVFLELVLKGFALWRAAKKDDKYWYIAILCLNTLGILPLVYIVFIKKDAHKS